MQLKVFEPAAVASRSYADDLDEFDLVGVVKPADSPEARRERYMALMAADKNSGLRDVLVATSVVVKRLEQVRKTCPNFSDAIGIAIRAATLSWKSRSPFRMPPLLLLGPPGIGKTRFARKLSEALGVPAIEYSMVGVDDTTLKGHSVSWKGARPGIVAKTLIEGESASPVIFVDEIDKPQRVGHADLLDPLHALLEPENARVFTDAYLEIPIRADQIIWIATANEIYHLKPSIVARFLVLEIPAPNQSEQRAIIQSLYDHVSGLHGRFFDSELSSELVESLTDDPPRRARMLIELAMGLAVSQQRKSISRADIEEARRLTTDDAQRRRIGFLSQMS